MSTRIILMCIIWSVSIGAHPSYIVRVQAPDAASASTMAAFYKGEPLKQIDTQCYQVPETGSVAAFSVVIAPDIAYDSRDGGTIEALKTPENLPVRWFDVTYTPQEHTAWCVEERETFNMPRRVPEHTIYVLMNPYLIESLDVHEVGRGADRRSVFTLNLLREDTYETEDISLHALMASVDAKAFHAQRHQERHERNVTISMLYQ